MPSVRVLALAKRCFQRRDALWMVPTYLRKITSFDDVRAVPDPDDQGDTWAAAAGSESTARQSQTAAPHALHQ